MKTAQQTKRHTVTNTATGQIDRFKTRVAAEKWFSALSALGYAVVLDVARRALANLRDSDSEGIMYHDMSTTDNDVKICKDCGRKIEYLADFPGPRCLVCHAKKVENEPLEKPNFIKAINIKKRK